MIDQQTYDHIHAYFEGELSMDEIVAFEERKLHDTSFAEQVELYEAAENAIIDNRLLGVKEKLESKRKGKPSKGKWIFGGVLLALITVCAYLFNPSEQQQQSEPESEAIESGSRKNQRKPEEKTAVENSSLAREVELVESTVHNNEVLKDLNYVVSEDKNIQVLTDSSESDDRVIVDEQEAVVGESKIEHQPILNSPIVDACEGVKIDFAINTTKPCIGEQDGAIKVDRIEGGMSPYRIIVLDERLEPADVVDELRKGDYTIRVMDANDCMSESKLISLKAKGCFDQGQENGRIIPAMNEVWDLPLRENETCEFVVSDQNGQQVQTIKVEYGLPVSWDGVSSGVNLSSGLYLYEKRVRGKVTLVGTVTIVE